MWSLQGPWIAVLRGRQHALSSVLCKTHTQTLLPSSRMHPFSCVVSALGKTTLSSRCCCLTLTSSYSILQSECLGTCGAESHCGLFVDICVCVRVHVHECILEWKNSPKMFQRRQHRKKQMLCEAISMDAATLGQVGFANTPFHYVMLPWLCRRWTWR